MIPWYTVILALGAAFFLGCILADTLGGWLVYFLVSRGPSVLRREAALEMLDQAEARLAIVVCHDRLHGGLGGDRIAMAVMRSVETGERLAATGGPK